MKRLVIVLSFLSFFFLSCKPRRSSGLKSEGVAQDSCSDYNASNFLIENLNTSLVDYIGNNRKLIPEEKSDIALIKSVPPTAWDQNCPELLFAESSLHTWKRFFWACKGSKTVFGYDLRTGEKAQWELRDSIRSLHFDRMKVFLDVVTEKGLTVILAQTLREGKSTYDVSQYEFKSQNNRPPFQAEISEDWDSIAKLLGTGGLNKLFRFYNDERFFFYADQRSFSDARLLDLAQVSREGRAYLLKQTKFDPEFRHVRRLDFARGEPFESSVLSRSDSGLDFNAALIDVQAATPVTHCGILWGSMEGPGRSSLALDSCAENFSDRQRGQTFYAPSFAALLQCDQGVDNKCIFHIHKLIHSPERLEHESGARQKYKFRASWRENEVSFSRFQDAADGYGFSILGEHILAVSKSQNLNGKVMSLVRFFTPTSLVNGKPVCAGKGVQRLFWGMPVGNFGCEEFRFTVEGKISHMSFVQDGGSLQRDAPALKIEGSKNIYFNFIFERNGVQQYRRLNLNRALLFEPLAEIRGVTDGKFANLCQVLYVQDGDKSKVNLLDLRGFRFEQQRQGGNLKSVVEESARISEILALEDQIPIAGYLDNRHFVAVTQASELSLLKVDHNGASTDLKKLRLDHGLSFASIKALSAGADGKSLLALISGKGGSENKEINDTQRTHKQDFYLAQFDLNGQKQSLVEIKDPFLVNAMSRMLLVSFVHSRVNQDEIFLLFKPDGAMLERAQKQNVRIKVGVWLAIKTGEVRVLEDSSPWFDRSPVVMAQEPIQFGGSQDFSLFGMFDGSIMRFIRTGQVYRSFAGWVRPHSGREISVLTTRPVYKTEMKNKDIPAQAQIISGDHVGNIVFSSCSEYTSRTTNNFPNSTMLSYPPCQTTEELAKPIDLKAWDSCVQAMICRDSTISRTQDIPQAAASPESNNRGVKSLHVSPSGDLLWVNYQDGLGRVYWVGEKVEFR